jgi:hypothetical protein
MFENNNIIKIGICHNYCCKENWYEIYYISKNNVKYKEGNKNKYENCEFKLYSQDC